MIVETRGISYYPEYSIPLSCYLDERYLIQSNGCKNYRIAFIEDGMGIMHVNGRDISVLPNTILCLAETEEAVPTKLTNVKMFLICFHPSVINNRLDFDRINNDKGLSISDSQDKQFLKPFFIRDNTFDVFINLHMETARRIKEILKHLYEQTVIQSDSWPCLSRSYLIELLFLIERTYSFQKVKAENSISRAKLPMDSLINYIHENYMNKITIDGLIKTFNTNRTTLSKEFKQATGLSVISYIIKLRVQVAAAMLRDTYLSVSNIIERVGFNNVTHFNNIFKEYTGYLPSQYRKCFNKVYGDISE
jgi:AraC family L-rhamnose operon regulatory protein RhaS